MTISAVNDPPRLADDMANLVEDGRTTVNMLGNDEDIDGSINPTSIEILAQPESGSAEVQPDGTVDYTPGNNFDGEDRFTYRVSDNEMALSAPAKVTATVASVNDAPEISVRTPTSGQPQTRIDEDSAYHLQVTAVDIDSENLVFSIENLPAWQGLPSVVGAEVTLAVQLTHSGGPTVDEGKLLVDFAGDSDVTNVGDSLSETAFDCPVDLARAETHTLLFNIDPVSAGDTIATLELFDGRGEYKWGPIQYILPRGGVELCGE